MDLKTTYNKAAPAYDRARRQLVPNFDTFYGTVIERLPFDRNDAIKALDLGAGTGLLSQRVLEAYPKASVKLVDLSEDMLAQARDRLSEHQDRTAFEVLDYACDEPDGEFDAIVSAISIHHIEHQDKRRLFKTLYGRLRGGGIFINADQVLGDTPDLQKTYHEAWLNQVQASGIREDDLNSALERMKQDKLATLGDQIKWLTEAGFENVHCWYQHYSLVVYSGTKTGIAE